MWHMHLSYTVIQKKHIKEHLEDSIAQFVS